LPIKLPIFPTIGIRAKLRISTNYEEMQSLKFGIERFDGRMNLGLWQIQVKDILIQCGLHKMLRGIPTSSSSDGVEKSDISNLDWEDLDLRVASSIWLCLAKNVLANVQGTSTEKEL
jgi:hypothetical protein